MIEKMIVRFKSHLPVKIEEVSWDEATLIIGGQDWGMATMSGWRVCYRDRVAYGCYDKSIDLDSLLGISVVDIGIQESRLKIDPVFFLSNGLILEVFSTDTFEPWIFHFGKPIDFYSAVPADPSLFDMSET